MGDPAAHIGSSRDGYRGVMPGAETVSGLLAARVRRDGARPLVTYIDSAQRMELSAVSLANAVAKAAGLLRDDLDVQPGDHVTVALPLHWQSAVWWGACAAVEAVMNPVPELIRTADDPLPVRTPAARTPVGVATAVNLAAIAECDDRIAVSLAPFGLPDGSPSSPGVIEAAVAARVHPDDFIAFTPPDPSAPLLHYGAVTLTSRQCLDRAAVLAQVWDLRPGGRLLVSDTTWLGAGHNSPATDDRVIDGWLALLAVPLVADASVVLASGVAPERAVEEGITAVMPTP